MTKLYQPSQLQTNLSENSQLLTTQKMPSYYPSTRHRTFITKHLTENYDDDDPDSIYKEQFILQVFQHWKLKTLEHQQTINNSGHSNNHFSQALSNKTSLVETSNIVTNSNEISLNNKNNEILNTNEPEKSITIVQKTVTSLPASSTHRGRTLRKSISMPSEFSNPNLLTPYVRPRSETTTKPVSKKPKPSPIFIAPKKTQPSLPPRLYSTVSLDEPTQIKRKNSSEKQNSIGDEQNSASVSPTWTPASSTTQTRFYFQSSTNSLDNDGTSSDESDHESLLIRNKKLVKKITKNPILSIHSNLIIPTAILITDPNGNIHTFDINNMEEFNNTQRIIDNDHIAININNKSDYSSSSIPSTSPINHDKYGLHSIGEEEEELIEKNNNNGIILSKELNRIEAFTRSRQINTNVQKTDKNCENNKIQLDRRWSDSAVSDDEENIQSPMVKIASITSIIKQPSIPPVKISKTKYFLMKLHLISSSNKDDDSNTSSTNPPPPRKRTVHRSSDKKHSNANLEISPLSPDDPKQRPNFQRLDSSSKGSLKNTGVLQRSFLETDIITPSNKDYNREYSRQSRTGSTKSHGSTADSDDDIDGTFQNAKKGLRKRVSSIRDLSSSISRMNSVFSEVNARYDLDISGTIILKLTYNSQIGSLDVLISKCTNLAAAKRDGKSNPYCKLYLLPDKSKASKRTTSIKKDTIEPIFDEKLRYYLSKEEFASRILWISVWSQTSITQDDFLGEIHIPLVNRALDKLEEHRLSARTQEEFIPENFEPTTDISELSFDLNFMEHPTNKQLGTIQVNAIHGTGIYYGNKDVDALCKGILMPDKIKRKLSTTRKGPSPKWNIPIRWEGIRLNNLPNTSIEISIWSQERFRKTMIGFIRLSSVKESRNAKSTKSLDVTDQEKSVWELFLEKPTKIHQVRLPLRPATDERK